MNKPSRLNKIAALFRAIFYHIFGATRWRKELIEEHEVSAFEQEGFQMVNLVCSFCDYSEFGMIDPSHANRNFECGRCHHISSRVKEYSY